MTAAAREPPPFWVSAFAGGLAGLCETPFSYPIEFLKIRRVLAPSHTYPQLCRDVLQNHGVLGFYRGMSVVMLTAIPKSTTRFALNDAGLKELARRRGLSSTRDLGVLDRLIAATAAGLICSVLVIVPMETLKVYMIDTATYGSRRGLLSSVGTFLRSRGFFALYHGAYPTMIKNTLNTTVRWPAQHYIASALDTVAPQRMRDSKAGHIALQSSAGVGAGVFSVLCTQPADVCSIRMRRSVSPPDSAVAAAREVFAQCGLKGFYAGTLTRLVRVVPENAVLFAAYPAAVQSLLWVRKTDTVSRWTTTDKDASAP